MGGWGVTRDAARWLEQLGATYKEAQELEAAEREAQARSVAPLYLIHSACCMA